MHDCGYFGSRRLLHLPARRCAAPAMHATGSSRAMQARAAPRRFTGTVFAGVGRIRLPCHAVNVWSRWSVRRQSAVVPSASRSVRFVGWLLSSSFHGRSGYSYGEFRIGCA